ncbi:MAG: tRNA (adenosine(37)-N6)-threonylcarbamoyltransferase complex dimerization subunit type 1 TsaB [Lentisphaerae bacterium]|nr:tRNA (adenosine(37)-N6)-threonylcarbamoyltransferase complex dimerization subunit type 1 TsaB [Lentisphaerota bacterium]
MIEAALDCSQGAALAICRDGVLLQELCLPGDGRDSDRLLASWLVAQCTQLGLSLAEIERWTVGTGPGSFAGLRCGIALVKGICLSSRAAMRGVPSAYALGKNAATAAALSPGQKVGVLHDGRCGQVILSQFRLGEDGEPALFVPPAPQNPQDLLLPECACDLWVALSGQRLPELPPALMQSLRLEDYVPAAQLLTASGWPWPVTAAQEEESCTPLYIRQAVFVRPAAVRQVE